MFGDPILTEKDETLTALSDSCILKAGKFIKADDISDADKYIPALLKYALYLLGNILFIK